MKIWKKTALLALAALVASAAWSETLETLRARRRIYAPSVPTAFDWASVPAQGAFLKANASFVPEARATQVRVARQGSDLLVRMEMTERKSDVFAGREKFTLWQNDYAEVMLVTPETKTRRACLHASVDFLGRVSFLEDAESTELPGTFNSKKLDPSAISAKAERTPDGWAAEFRIPVGDFAAPLPANFCRFHRSPYGFSSWSQSKAFCDQRFFGEIVFAPDRDNGPAYSRAVADFQRERASILARYKERVYDWRWAWGAADGYRPLGVRYSAASGHGWTQPFGLYETPADVVAKRTREQALSALADQAVVGEAANVFRIDLPNGRYKVHVLCGPVGKRREFALRANGAKVLDFSVGDKLFCPWDFSVDVTDGRLELAFVPAEVKPRPETDAYAAIAARVTGGFAVNSIVVYPQGDQAAAGRQLARDELEIRVFAPEELANRELVTFADADDAYRPTAAERARGWVAFSRPLGENVCAGSRPRSAAEVAVPLRVRAAPGEKFHIAFGLLPLRDAAAQPWTAGGALPLRVREALQEPWEVSGGKYAFVPYALEEAAFVDRDLVAGVARHVWLTGTVPSDAKPGVLDCSFSVGADAVPLEVEVLPFALDAVDFLYGGYHPAGYGIPACYEDVVARACADNGINALVLYVWGERDSPGSFAKLVERIKIYERAGLHGTYPIYCSLRDRVNHQLKKRQIKEIPQDVIDEQIALARKVRDLSKEIPTHPRLYWTSMDEAHCQGEPYWTEQIRLFKAVKAAVPDILTCGSESERSYRRSAPWMDVPILFEVPDFNAIEGKKEIWSYPNQMMLGGVNANAGRFCTGLLPCVTPVRGILPWQLMRARGNSPIRAGLWEMLTPRGTGGYRVIPRLVTVLGEVGVTDQRYFATLKRLVAAGRNGTAEQCREAERQQMLLDMIREGTKPSFMYYYYNGHLPASTYETVRTRLTDGILALRKAGVR